MNNRLMFVDTETGGTNPQKHTLLSIGLVVWDKNDGELYAAEYSLKHDNYVITKTAQRINHFPQDHNVDGSVMPLEAIDQICELKDLYFSDHTAIPLAGHNTHFDSQFIRKLFEDHGKSYEKIFSHRLVDTYSILKFLSDCAIIHDDVLSSAKAFKYFKINVNGRHTALGDARATMQMYEKLLSLLEQKLVS